MGSMVKMWPSFITPTALLPAADRQGKACCNMCHDARQQQKHTVVGYVGLAMEQAANAMAAVRGHY
jgi:hypothetical protein